jgi:hypothetical protein
MQSAFCLVRREGGSLSFRGGKSDARKLYVVISSDQLEVLVTVPQDFKVACKGPCLRREPDLRAGASSAQLPTSHRFEEDIRDGSASGRVKLKLIFEIPVPRTLCTQNKCELVSCSIPQPFQAGFILSVSSNCLARLRTSGPRHSGTCTGLTSEAIVYREAFARPSVTITEMISFRCFLPSS